MATGVTQNMVPRNFRHIEILEGVIHSIDDVLTKTGYRLLIEEIWDKLWVYRGRGAFKSKMLPPEWVHETFGTLAIYI